MILEKLKNHLKTLLRQTLVVTLLFWGGAAMAAGKPSLNAEELLRMALEKARSIDPEAYLVYASYEDGTRNLKFDGGTFIFFSPEKERAGLPSFCVKLIFYDGKFQKTRSSGYSRIALKGMELTPEKAIEAAMTKEMGRWWKEHPQAKLSTLLAPAEYVHRAPGFGDRSRKDAFVWELYLYGFGLAEQMRCYVNAKSLGFLGCRRIPVPAHFRGITPAKAGKELNTVLKKERGRK